jgi:hypothetical protein
MAAGSSSSGNQQKLTAGSRVSCTTYNGEKVEGEVLVFDSSHKILILSILFTDIDFEETCFKHITFIVPFYSFIAHLIAVKLPH